MDNSGAGAAWVFTRSGGTWTQQGLKLVGSGAVGAAEQGFSVALSGDGNTAIVGGYVDNGVTGAAWVFTRGGDTWTQQPRKLVGTGASRGALGKAPRSRCLAAAIPRSSVGPNDNSTAGAAWVFTRGGGVWTQQGLKLVGSGAVGNV